MTLLRIILKNHSIAFCDNSFILLIDIVMNNIICILLPYLLQNIDNILEL
jgi:hypothetical protein